jgi:hypothetical protein
MLARVALVLACCLAALGSAGSTQRRDVIRETESATDVDVHVKPADAGVGWIIVAMNLRERETIRLVWDESTFVTRSGRSLGRLIRGDTRIIHGDQVQPASPIAPRARLVEYCVPEQLAGHADSRIVQGVSGELRLVFDTDTGRTTWVGSVTLAPKSSE